MAVDLLVDHYITYVQKRFVARGYIGPFVLLYLIWIYLWVAVYGTNDYWEMGCALLAIIAILQVTLIKFSIIASTYITHMKCYFY